VIVTGLGWDSHRFAEGRKFVLGGVQFPEAERGLTGHSDADVLAHAVTDALLGAAGLGDIGEHFPDTDPRYEDADSIVLLRHAAELVRDAGWALLNLDATVVCEHPKLAPRRAEVRASLGHALNLDPERVSVKASTAERMGAIGRGEGAVAMAIVTLESR
jgi:2-C-methyl-D-erythritol 2,4-cyclodiphosphate synthase